MADKKKAPAKKAAPKAAAPKAAGRPRNVVKLTEAELTYEMKNFIASITSRTSLDGDDVAVAALHMAMAQCQVTGPSVMASKVQAICDSLRG